MSIGYTPYGIPVYPGDYDGWDFSDGFPNSPTNIADRAAAEAERRFVRQLNRRFDMTGVPVLTRKSTVGDIKTAVNGIRSRLASAMCVAFAAVSLSSFGALTVSKVNANDLGDTNVVVDVSFDGEIVVVPQASATNLTEEAEFFDNIRTNSKPNVTAAFSNAVMSVSGGNEAGKLVVRTGEESVVIKTSDGRTAMSVSADLDGNQTVVHPSVLRVGDLTDIWLGGEVVGGKVTGGETVHGRVSRMIEDASFVAADVTFTNGLEEGRSIGELKVGDRTFVVRIPSSVSATNLTDLTDMFDSIRTNADDSVTHSFSNAVAKFSPSAAPQDFDARSLMHKDLMFDDLRTNREETATHSFSNAVAKFSPSAAPQDFDARSLMHKDLMFDDVRTNKNQSVTVSFSNAVASVVSVPEAGMHVVPLGSDTPVTKTSGNVTAMSVSADTEGNQVVVNAKTIRVGDLTDIWIGGSFTNGGKIVGGETAHGRVSRMIQKAMVKPPDVSLTNALSSGTHVGSLKVGQNLYPILVPDRTEVTVVPSSDYGVPVGTVTVDGVSKTLFAPSVSTRALEVGTDSAYIDSSLNLHSYDNVNTEAWDVYALSTVTSLLSEAYSAPYSFTNLMCTCVLTNLGSRTSPTYRWSLDPSTLVMTPGYNPLNYYSYSDVHVTFPPTEAGFSYKSSQYSAEGFVHWFSWKSDPYADNIKGSDYSTVTFFDQDNKAHGYCHSTLFVRRSPPGLDEGRVVSEHRVDKIVSDMIGGAGYLRGSGVHSNAYIRYDGDSMRVSLSFVTNSVKLTTRNRTDVDRFTDSTELVPTSPTSWHGPAYLSSLDDPSYMSGSLWNNVNVSIDDSGIYYVEYFNNSGTCSYRSIGQQNVLSDRVEIRLQEVSTDPYYRYMVIFLSEADTPVAGYVETKTPGKVAFSNDLSYVAYTGTMKATNELSGTMVEIEPYTTDGTTIQWRIK